ncbi:hypothetical protein [Streptomyces fuscigenes]|uniref:hypothetical protein n=1 Tax=Streptomyces fuscigenes TaxID=1528880 RepID=UPI001F2F3327|nr:hypothetical protein [Streptomyces fuscigenes]MCF3964297.1 hypothetical protein [Streptomyces fuscigenes]
MSDTSPDHRTEDPEEAAETGAGAPPDPDEAGPRHPAPGPAGPAPLGVERAATGDARVDARLARLADADHLATDGHIEVYEDVHQGLREALSALDARPAPPAYDHRS